MWFHRFISRYQFSKNKTTFWVEQQPSHKGNRPSTSNRNASSSQNMPRSATAEQSQSNPKNNRKPNKTQAKSKNKPKGKPSVGMDIDWTHCKNEHSIKFESWNSRWFHFAVFPLKRWIAILWHSKLTYCSVAPQNITSKLFSFTQNNTIWLHWIFARFR